MRSATGRPGSATVSSGFMLVRFGCRIEPVLNGASARHMKGF
jgi:hypothetical protein